MNLELFSGGRLVHMRNLWALGVVAALVGCVAATLTAIASPDGGWTDGFRWSIYMLAAASIAAIVGLIFGVPRSRADYAATETERYSSNSNLEQISDWLTKVLVGASLVELTKIPGAMGDLGDFLGRDLGIENPQAFAASAVTYGVGVGFGTGYLWSRLRLRYLLEISDKDAAEASKRAAAVEGLLTMPNPGVSVAAVRTVVNQAVARTALTTSAERLPVLWVDDVPSNNTGIVNALNALDIVVHQVLSTRDAIRRLQQEEYAVIISDLGRREDGRNVEMAGLELLNELAQMSVATPVIIFAGARALRHEDELRGAGASLVTQRPSEVFSEAVRCVTGERAERSQNP
jgi:CheY-like chemotaxis protein